MMTWKKALELTPNQFIKRMQLELGNCNYETIAKMIYRSKSRLQTWCAPNSVEPLPISERHHIFLAVSQRKPPRLWSESDDDFLISNLGVLTYAQIGETLQRSESSVTLRVHKLKSLKIINKKRINRGGRK